MRFGDRRTLNLRASLPTVDEAVRRADIWLRERQLERADELLIVTGRGNSSEGGISPVREAVVRLLQSLVRKGVVANYGEHTPGSFVVRVAPVVARPAAAPPPARTPDPTPASLSELSTETRRLLRDLAERVLEGLGVADTSKFIAPEMLRQFGLVAARVPDGPDRERRLTAALREELDQHE